MRGRIQEPVQEPSSSRLEDKKSAQRDLRLRLGAGDPRGLPGTPDAVNPVPPKPRDPKPRPPETREPSVQDLRKELSLSSGCDAALITEPAVETSPCLQQVVEGRLAMLGGARPLFEVKDSSID